MLSGRPLKVVPTPAPGIFLVLYIRTLLLQPSRTFLVHWLKSEGALRVPTEASQAGQKWDFFSNLTFFAIRLRAKRFSNPVLVCQTITENVYAVPLRSLEVKVTPSPKVRFRGPSPKLFFEDNFSITCSKTLSAYTIRSVALIRTRGCLI